MTRSGGLTLEEHLEEREAAERSYAAGRDAEIERQLWTQHLNAARKEVEIFWSHRPDLLNQWLDDAEAARQ